jgi:hemerythrin superfamily protein
MRDLFQHIVEEHLELAAMLDKLSNRYSEPGFQKLMVALKAHMDAEEASLYPAMEGREHEMVRHAIEDHEEARKLLRSMSRGRKEHFKASLSELTALIVAHMIEEEEAMLPRAKEMFDQDEIEVISNKYDEVDHKVMLRTK